MEKYKKLGEQAKGVEAEYEEAAHEKAEQSTRVSELEAELESKEETAEEHSTMYPAGVSPPGGNKGLPTMAWGPAVSPRLRRRAVLRT